MSTLVDEELIPFQEAAKLVKPNGVNRATISRWAFPGVRGVRLEACRIGGRMYTSREALQRFLNECNRRGALRY